MVFRANAFFVSILRFRVATGFATHRRFTSKPRESKRNTGASHPTQNSMSLPLDTVDGGNLAPPRIPKAL